MKILVVEDEGLIQGLFATQAKAHGMELLQAKTLAEAKKLIAEHGTSIDAILWDEELPDGHSSEKIISQTWRDGYRGLMISISSTHEREQLEAGCSHSFPKSRALKMTLALLRIT